MGLIDDILSMRKPAFWSRFRGLRRRPVPPMPDSPEAAYKMGLQRGYGEGLVDGVGLGVDVSTAITVSETRLSDSYLLL